jgi:hypothetical protein
MKPRTATESRPYLYFGIVKLDANENEGGYAEPPVEAFLKM